MAVSGGELGGMSIKGRDGGVDFHWVIRPLRRIDEVPATFQKAHVAS
jgi:hypothetical protein